MLKRRTPYPLLVFLCLSFILHAQVDKTKFTRSYTKAGTKNRLLLMAATPYDELKTIFPHIKDTIERIKRAVYQKYPSDAKELKFLLDRVEAEAELDNRNYEKATLILESAIQSHAETINDSLRALSMMKLAFVKMRNFNRAFEINNLLENKWKRKNDTAHIDFGVSKTHLYVLMGLKAEAMSQRRKDFNSRQNKHDTDAFINYYNDMGVFFNNVKNSDSAEIYFLKAQNLLVNKDIPKNKESYYEFYKGLIDGNLALSYYNRGKINDALPLLRHDVYSSLRTGFFESAFNSYNLLAQCHIQLKNKKLAYEFLDTAQTLMYDKLKGASFKLRLLPTQASYYSLINDYKRSAQAYRNYFALKDSFTSLEKEKEVINQEMSFNIEQREIENLEREQLVKQMQLDEAQDKSYRIYFYAGFIILALVILFLVVNNQGSKKREYQLSFKNKQIQQQNSQIEQSLKDKEALIKEIHHRVKNNLQIITSMLNLQMGKVDDEKTNLILFEAKQRINAIALTHQMLYQKVTTTNIHIGEYMEGLVRQVEKTMATPLIELKTNIAPINKLLTIDGAVPLGLIINELLTNAYKHAFPNGRQGRITVSLTENATTLTIGVSDNGVGLAEDFETSENKTLGIELIYILADQLDSQLIIERGAETTFKFDIQKTQLK